MTGPADLLEQNVRLVHGRDTCDDGGRPLSRYVCDYHQGYRDALDEAAARRWTQADMTADEYADMRDLIADADQMGGG